MNDEQKMEFLQAIPDMLRSIPSCAAVVLLVIASIGAACGTQDAMPMAVVGCGFVILAVAWRKG